MLQIYNSLTRRKEAFKPIDPGRVRMYVCGITVYDYCHVGHARMFVVFDTIVRYLRARGFDVTYVRNITDIDDKIIRRAQENSEPVDALTERFIAAMYEDTDALSVLRADLEPRATASIAAIVAMIQALQARGYAYQATNGDVYYDVSRFDGYGKLSGKRTEDLRSGARVEVDEAKDDPLDFVLWKAAKPGEPSWPSPWGPGRPGWHIECSAMSTAALGNRFDIHGGGMDLKFPHHENEIAQSEAACGCRYVNYWIHNGFVQVDEEKMSKSLGNFFTVREVLRQYRAEALRYFILSSHYRKPLNYTEQNLRQAEEALDRLYTSMRGLTSAEVGEPSEFDDRFTQAMDDDFNTPEAMAVLFDLAREINRERGVDAERATALSGTLRRLGGVLGLLQQNPDVWLKSRPGATEGFSDHDIQRLIERRQRARSGRDWAAADRIRNELVEAGVQLEDGPDGTTWRRN